MSKEEQPGARSTVSPGEAAAKARWTASRSDGQATTGVAGGPLDQTKLNDIIANLEKAQETLGERRSGLASDAAGIARAKAFNDRVATLYTTFAEKVEQADTNEAAAQATSLQLRQELALESLKSITSVQSELVGLLR